MSKLKHNNISALVRAAIFGGVLAISQPALAGNNDGELKGHLISSNSNVSGVSVTVTNTGTGLTRTYTTDSDGNYRFNNLPVGNYKVEASVNGEKFSEESIRVTIGNAVNYNLRVSSDTNTVTIVGNRVSRIDQESTTSGIIIDAADLERLPVARDLTSVALLASGAVLGDNAFGRLPSFSGSTVGENAYSINGLNITNFRNGTGFSTVPFEFYEQFEVKTGGLSAEFGRSTGGVINAVTKSGSNEFEWGFNAYYSPDTFSGTNPNVFRRDGTVNVWNEADKRDSFDMNIYASGALIQDTLFYYALFNPRSRTSENVAALSGQHNDNDSNDAFFGAKIDWYITDEHILEFTGFSDKRKTTTIISDYDFGTRNNGAGIGEQIGESFEEEGGTNLIAKYTGIITDDFTVSALYGINQQDRTSLSTNDVDCPVIVDVRDVRPNGTLPGCWVNFLSESGDDEREAFRLDFEWFVGDDHQLRFGWDREVLTAKSSSGLSGGIYYRYIQTTPGASLPNGGVVPAGVTEAVRVRDFSGGGEFETISSAYYLEDIWSITDDVTLTLGIRNENFDNRNGTGGTFVKQTNQWAPRIGAAWDVNGDGESKLFVNFGRYHLPVATNTNIRMAGAETFIHRYYEIASEDATTFVPTLGNEIGTALILSDGTVPDVREVLDLDLKPMYQDEIILGYQRNFGESWTGGVTFTRRDLASTIEDVIIDHAYASHGITGAPGNQYVLTNPGTGIRTYVDVNGDGNLELIEFTAEELQYPKSERYYNAFDFNLDRAFDGVWGLHASYTWAQSYGNNEGYVRSDNGQDDAGLTTLFDFPELTDGAYGRLPNDRSHVIKMYGNYALTEDLIGGFNFVASSGRPINGFGAAHPNFGGDAPYGQTFFLLPEGADGNVASNFIPSPRGTYGKTPFTTTLDLSLAYNIDISESLLNVKLDLFNVFNAANAIEVNETAQNSGNQDNPTFLLPTSFQAPRSVRLSLSMKF